MSGSKHIKNIFSTLRRKQHTTELRQEEGETATGTGKSFIKDFTTRYNQQWQLVVSFIVLAISIAIYLTYSETLRLDNARLKDELRTSADALERYRIMGRKIINENVINAKDKAIKLANDNLAACNKILANRDYMIERSFTDVDGNRITDRALWKWYYMETSDGMIERLKRHGFDISKDDMSLAQWGDNLPTRDEIARNQKLCWIQGDIAEIVIRNRASVTDIYNLRFTDKPLTDYNLQRDIFTPIAFNLRVRVVQSMLLYLLSDLLKSEMNYFIEVVNLDAAGGNQPYQPTKADESFYTVEIYAYSMDFVNEIYKENNGKS